MKRILLASAVLALSAGLSFAQTTSGTSTSGTSTTTTMPSTTDQGTGATSSGTNMSGDQGTDTTTTSGTTNPNSARDCAPGQQTGSAQQAAPGQQDTAAKSRRAGPGEKDRRRLLIGTSAQVGITSVWLASLPRPPPELTRLASKLPPAEHQSRNLCA
ncbi:hypothetical protein [Mesorhizobium sp. M0296]